jgi:hypothetical protein
MGDDDFTDKDFSLLGRNPARHHFVRAHPIAGRTERTRLEERDRRDGQTSGRQTAQHSRRLASPISTRLYSIHGVRASFTRSSTEPEPCRPSQSGNVGTGLPAPRSQIVEHTLTPEPRGRDQTPVIPRSNRCANS